LVAIHSETRIFIRATGLFHGRQRKLEIPN